MFRYYYESPGLFILQYNGYSFHCSSVLNRLRIDGMAVSPETIKADYEMGKGVVARDTGRYLELEDEQFDEPLFFEVTYYENCSVLVSVQPVTSQR